jgi:hypothetical protein
MNKPIGSHTKAFRRENPAYQTVVTIILKYGLLYVFSQRYAAMLGYSDLRKSILGASVVQLRVVAPAAYYLRFRMDWLQSEANLGLGSLRLEDTRWIFGSRHDLANSRKGSFCGHRPYIGLPVMKYALSDRGR